MLELKSHRLIIDQKTTYAHHASTVLPLSNGHVLTAWFGGSRESHPDVGIWMAEKDEKGFSAPRLIDQTNEPHWNPVLFECADHRIILFYKLGFKIPDWRTMYVESYDQGKTWTAPKELVAGDETGGRGPVRNKPIRLKSGRVLAPASVERGIWTCFIDISDDDCHTWTRSNVIDIPALRPLNDEMLKWQKIMQEQGPSFDRSQLPPEIRHGRGVIQPTLWEDAKGVHCLMRSGEGAIYRSDSVDDGTTWTEAYPIDMANNNSGIDLTRLDNGVMLLVYNPIKENFGLRSPISVAASYDDGVTWEKLCDLQTEPGEFSYPAIVSEGNKIWITYTHKRENVTYWEFNWKD